MREIGKARKSEIVIGKERDREREKGKRDREKTKRECEVKRVIGNELKGTKG